MPSIPESYIRSIAILLRNHPETGAVEPVGTAFLVQTREFVLPPVHVYLVTCHHCIAAATMVRFHDDTVLEVKRADWVLAPSGDDVAVIDITDRLPAAIVADACIPLGLLAQDHGEYHLGDEIYMLGLHVNERDTGTNHPRARFGNVSARASDKAPIMQGNGSVGPTHIGDMRSRTGFSGSPVFVYFEIPGLSGDVQTKHALFGIHSDQFREPIHIVVGGTERRAEIGSSMTKIVPAWVLTFIDVHEDLVAQRGRREADYRATMSSRR